VIITKVEAFGYRCLREVRRELGPYQILVGPNGSGKSVFLDVIGFLGDLVSGGLRQAVADRTENFYDLVWGRGDGSFHLAIEARAACENGKGFTSSPGLIRYEIEAEIYDDPEIGIAKELLTVDGATVITGRGFEITSFPETGLPKQIDSAGTGDDAALANLGGDLRFPSARQLYSLLENGCRRVVLDNERLRAAHRLGRGESAVFDGSNLARLVAQLQAAPGGLFKSWLEHVQTAIPEIVDIRTILRPEDKHRYLMLKYPGGVEVPQWMLSDGTLRLLALTILAYLPDIHGVYLIEEPEVGVHPTAIETIMQSLSSVYEGQVLVTSHSPIVLSLARPDQLLCFQKSEDGTKIIPGNEHPMLREWKAGLNVSDLFAAGVLG